MTIDEAIKNCEKKAEEERKDYETAVALNIPSEGCLKRAEEQEQLAEWLKELKKRRETMEMIKKLYILVEKGVRDNPDDLMIGRAPTVEPQNEWGEWVKKEDVIDLLKKWADGYCYLEIPIDDAIKGIENMKGGAE